MSNKTAHGVAQRKQLNKEGVGGVVVFVAVVVYIWVWGAGVMECGRY